MNRPGVARGGFATHRADGIRNAKPERFVTAAGAGLPPDLGGQVLRSPYTCGGEVGFPAAVFSDTIDFTGVRDWAFPARIP